MTTSPEVTSAGNGRGVGRVLEGGKRVVIPTTVAFEARDAMTGEVLFSETEHFAKGHRGQGVTCTSPPIFVGTVAELAGFDPEGADILRAAGADDEDVVTLGLTAQALLRGRVARSGR